MTSMFRAALLAITTTFATMQLVHADGRADWRDYAWQRIDIADCTAVASTLECPPYHEKWDWKRDQWVDITVTIDVGSGTLQLHQRLTDRDRHDKDYVCVTALVLDAAGNNLVAHHQNWHMGPGDDEAKSFTYRSDRLADTSAIHIGSKQCRQGASQDDAVYDLVLARIHS